MSKSGFDYYSTDTDRYQDTRIRKLKNRFGAAGIAIYDYILSEVYREDGCYLKWRDDTAFGVADYFRIEEDTVIAIVEYCLEIGLFHEPSFRSKSILTSESIQRRYVVMCTRAKRTNTSVPDEVLIKSENTELREEMANLTEEMAKLPEETEKVPEVSRKVKYSKVEYKEEERKDYTSYSPKESETTTTISRFKKPTIEEIAAYLQEKKITGFTAEKFHAYYESKGWLIGKTPMKNWKAAIVTWKANNGNNGFSSGGKPAANIGLSKPLSKKYDTTRTSL